MTPAFVALILGLVLGLASGGQLSRLRDISLRYEPVVAVLFVLQAVLRGRLSSFTTATPFAFAGWVISVVLLIAVLLPSRAQNGIPLVMVAMAFNLLVVLANHGMPVVVTGIPSLASRAAAQTAASGGFYHLAHPGEVLLILSDCLRLHAGISTLMLSVGDVLLMVGAVVFVARHMLEDPGSASFSSGWMRVTVSPLGTD